MTQREDALKFEQGRIKALQEERLHIQKKTFTKWVNSFLQKARMEVDDLFADLSDGRRLLRLLEIISGERLAKPNSGRMRVHKIENVNKSLAFLHTKVRLESIGAEDIVDGNPRLILGLIWTIILRFQIQEIEIDVDEENESSEKKSAKDALLLWCQRKTNGYHGVHIHNFTDSWRSGLGFNALIHAHRPELFRYQDLHAKSHIDTLNHAFDVAHAHLGIPKLLDAEDVDTTRPDEKSVMTYVASYYHTFARMKNEQKSGRRIANIIGQLMVVDAKKAEYARLLTALLEWIRDKISELDSRDLPNSLDGIQRLLLAFKQYRTVEKPPKYKERSEIEVLYFDINTMQKSLTGEGWTPAEGQLPQELERAWQQLEHAEHAREIALRTELLRHQRLEQLNYKFNTKSVLRKGYLKEMIQVLSDPRYGSNLAQVDATVKKHEAISADILARTERFEDLSAMAAELVRENYHGAEAVKQTEQQVASKWRELLSLLAEHRESLLRLAQLMALVREADTTLATVEEMHAQFSSEEVGPHLAGVERLAQAHALRELQLGALDESIRRLVRQGKQVHDEQHKLQLQHKLRQLEDAYDSLLAAAKDRKARLEDARNLYQFLEDHDEEEGWITDRQRICQTGVSAKDLRGVLALQQKHAALLQELRTREPVTARVLNKGKSLMDAKHPKSLEVERRLANLERQREVLHELAAAREQRLLSAAEAYQFYADANEAESWIKERRALAASADVGSDAPAAGALLARQKTLHEEISAYKPELDALQAQGKKLVEAGIDSLQLPSETDTGAAEEEEVVKETRLVPTEVWEEQPVERLEHRTVTEERSVPQVKALYAFSGQGISMAKGEVMFLINRTNPDWWSVRKADRTDGFVPANYVREIEPRIVPVQVRRPEKVRTVQRVKKTVLVKQVVSVKRPVTRRASRAPQPVDTVPARMKRIRDAYEELLALSTARRQQLEDAIQLYDFFAECDDFDKWLKEKEKLLRTDDAGDSVENAKRKYEKLVTDLSAASKRLERVDASADALVSAGHPQAPRVLQRQRELHHARDKLVRLKAAKEKSLEGASSMELFGRTCDEARDWMTEKALQLEAGAGAGGGGGADLRTVQALQRRHAQLERELEPLREKVNTVDLLADSVKSQYPSELSHVEKRQREVREMWLQCQAAAADKRARLENAVGHQIFQHSSAALHEWLQKIRAALASERVAKDVATAQALHKEHQELKDDIEAHSDEFKEVVQLGEKLVSNNPKLSDVAEKVAALKSEQAAVLKEWADKEEQLKQLVQLQTFNREADQVDASSGAHEAFLTNKELGNSVDEAMALLKRHEELEARLAAQDERLRALVNTGERLANAPHYAAAHIKSRVEQSKARRSAVRAAAADRRRALQASLAYQQFVAAADDLDAWIQDKMKTATDHNYRDLTNLERKLQKHEAYERELNANEKQLRDVDSIGQSLLASGTARAADIKERLARLHRAREALVVASRDKGAKLRQAAAQRTHKRSAEDAKARILELERALLSEETGADLRSCKRQLNQHTALETELMAIEARANELAEAGKDLVAAGHFDAETIEKDSAQLLTAASALREPSKTRRQKLEEGLKLHKLAAEIGNELQWMSERLPRAASDASPADLHSAQHAHKKHAKLREEIAGHEPVVEKVLRQADELAAGRTPDQNKVKELARALSKAYKELIRAADARATRLDSALKAQQFLHDALEVDSWLADKAAALASDDLGRDRHHAMQLLTKHKALELELDTYAAIVSEMGHAASNMAATQQPDAAALQKRQEELTQSLKRLQRLAAQRQKALLESMCRHEYVVESAELEQWIQEQLAAASSEDYGQDYEHLLVLRSKFEELRHRVETGSERFAQCEELAKKLVASESPYIPDIEKRQEALGECWQRLVEQIQSRGAKLAAAGEIHRFHRDVADALARMADKRAQLDVHDAPRDYNAALALLRRHETIENDLVALDAQLQVLQEDAARLQKLYPGGNVAQIARQQRALDEAWAALKASATERRQRLHAAVDLHRFLTQVRDLTSWSAGLRASMGGEPRVRDAGAAQALRAEHDAVKGEIEAREDSFRAALQLGQAMQGHSAAQEVEEKCAALLEERARLHGAWQARQVALDQLIDLHFFLRDSKQLHSLCAAQEAALGTEISPTSSVEEVDNQLKKHEAFEKLLITQDEKLSTLNSHGAKLLQQNHVESQLIADELEKVNQRRKKVHALSATRRQQLAEALLRAQFARDVAEMRYWIAGKMKKLEADQGQAGEVTSLEDKIKKLQKHQAFRAEVVANEERVAQVVRTAAELGSPDASRQLREEWAQLLSATEERGRGLEEAQDILEFNQNLDKIEAWIRDKEMMVQAHELGRDYEHCSALLRKLDDLDSDMRVDDKHMRSVCALADKLVDQGPSQQSKAVQQRRDAFLSKWKALSGALQDYREHLSAALEIHAFNRDVADTSERIAEKAALFSSTEAGRDLTAARELSRKHDALATEATAVGDKIREHEAAGQQLTNKYPERSKEIESRLKELSASWRQLQQLAGSRSRLLGNATVLHKLDEDIKELEVWVNESVKQMHSAAPPSSIAEADTLLELHNEKKAEIDGRQKSIASLREEAESLSSLPEADPEQIQAQVDRLANMAQTLERAVLQRNSYLTQAHQLQQLKEQARQTEDWLAEKEAFLNNDDLGESLAAVEALTRKHKDFATLLESQRGRVAELERYAAGVGEGHKDRAYIERRVRAIAARTNKLEESCAVRGQRLQQSRQLQLFMRDLLHEREWIALKMQIAADHSYWDLSNLQSKIQKHAAFESELQVNKNRVDDVVGHGEELIEAKHYASDEIRQHVTNLEGSWRELEEAARSKRDGLADAYQARVFLRGLDDLTLWLDDVEAQLLSDDHGKDLASVTALLKRHARLEQQVTARSETVSQLAETAQQLVDSEHSMAKQIRERSDALVSRYRSLQEPLSVRRDNLEDAALLQRWERDADEELAWMREREPACRSGDTGATLARAQKLHKKHAALEAELLSREPIVASLSARAAELARRGHFAGARLEAQAQKLHEALRALNELAAIRRKDLQDAIELHQFNVEATEVEGWLAERRPALVSADVGRDEDSVRSLQKKLEAQQREIAVADASLATLERLAAPLLERKMAEGESVKTRVAAVRKEYEELKLLTAKRQQRLEQSLKYYAFVRECEEVREWIDEQVATAASEEYGQDVEHVETLQHAFDNFLAGVHANEGRIEAVAEAGAALIEDNTPEADKVERRVEHLRGLWEDLKELTLARQEALAGARQVHVFDRTADETVAWIAEKDSALGSEPSFGPQHDLDTIQALVRKHEALGADLEAVKKQVDQLTAEAERLGAAFPDAKEHVYAKLEEVTEGLTALLERAKDSRGQLQRAEQLQTYFDSYQELMAWTSEALARVTAPELAHDVGGAELSVARHNDIKAEIRARDDAFATLYRDGEKLVSEGHFLSSEISERMAALRARRRLLDDTWARRAELYAQHLDALIFKRDADALDNWITAREPHVRDGKLGESVPQVEELIRKHDDLRKAIDSQRDKLNALSRLTLVEKAFRLQQDAEAEARRRGAERQEAERLEQTRRREMERIAEQRRKEDEVHASVPARHTLRETEQLSGSTEDSALDQPTPLESQPSFDKLSNVKRAESMNVTTKTAKRTPSFTTRRRTQSFRRHQRGDVADLPPVEIKGYLERKQEAGCGGKRATVRSWRQYYAVLCGQLLCFFRDETDWQHAKAAAPPVAILNARCSPAGDYTKRKHVFRLACADGAEFLFGCSSRDLMLEWCNKISFHAALPPQLQLTPYNAQQSPEALMREKLQRSDSLSSSGGESPEPTRHRTQTEILQEHRQSLHSARQAEIRERERVIESSVLPSLPPRQSEDPADLLMRKTDNNSTSPWGSTRFSNGRDPNTDFIRSQQLAYGGSAQSSPPSRPASVQSAAPEPRHLSESSGESELSVASVSTREKKKGVFGGLFSRKKRPQSHM